MRLAVRSICAWFVLLLVMILNGVVRVGILQPRLGEDLARQVASVAGIVIVFAAAWMFVRILGPATAGQLLGVGVLWLSLTLAFEFGFGHFVSGASWQTLAADYDVTRGRLWPFVLLATLIAPLACGSFRARQREARGPKRVISRGV